MKKIKTQKPLVGIILVFKKLLCEKNFSILFFFKLFKYKKYTHFKSFLQKKICIRRLSGVYIGVYDFIESFYKLPFAVKLE